MLVNPVAGRISDRTQTRWGARRPYLLFAGLAMAVLFASIFAAPFGTGAGAGLYVAVAFLATATAFAFFQVPYVAMPAEMTGRATSERTRLMTWRVALLALAILVSGALAPDHRGRRRRRHPRPPLDGPVRRAVMIVIGTRQRLPRHPRRADRRA